MFCRLGILDWKGKEDLRFVYIGLEIAYLWSERKITDIKWWPYGTLWYAMGDREMCRSRCVNMDHLGENSAPIPLTTPSFTFCLWSSENQIVGVRSRSRRTKPITKHGNVHSDWLILPLLLPTPTIWFSPDHKRKVIKQQSCKQSWKKMETFWFFWLQFCHAYDSAYDSDFWFSLGHKRSYDSTYDSDFDSVTSENQP